MTNQHRTPLAPTLLAKPLTGAVLRLVDILVAASMLLVGALPMILIAALIWREDKDSIFFRQTRVGQGGKTFEILKFRTMFTDPDRFTGAQAAEDGSKKARADFQTTTANDPRITRVGKFLRASHLDELPQVLNVLQGHMSLVGVRPDVPVQESDYTKQVWIDRHVLRPGITGMAQVAPDVDSTATRTRYDLEWVQTHSVSLYIKIILKTVVKVLRRNSF
ncbi:MAG: sugar transferase [Halocynthiibacter sp.]